MSSQNALAWESEYRDSKLLTLGTEPLASVRDFAKWLRRKRKVDMSDFFVLDLGCGNGKNLVYMVGEFARSGAGYDISPTAISEAVRLKGGLDIAYQVRSIDEPFPVGDGSVDLALDVTASNSLDEKGRSVFVSEVARVLKPGAFFFVRALCKDGDDNAKRLVREFPGVERDTYVLPGVGVTERVFSRQDFIDTYSPLFEVVSLERASGYQKWGNQSYRRNYWIAYLSRK